MMDKIWIIAGIGVAAGAVIAAAVLKKLDSGKKPALKPDKLTELVSGQLTCDSLDMGNVIAWFRENAGRTEGEAVFFLAKPTAHTAEMFAITGDIRQLDPEHNLIQAVVDRKTNLPVALRLVSCGSKPRLIEERMGDRDYMVITND